MPHVVNPNRARSIPPAPGNRGMRVALAAGRNLRAPPSQDEAAPDAAGPAGAHDAGQPKYEQLLDSAVDVLDLWVASLRAGGAPLDRDEGSGIGAR